MCKAYMKQKLIVFNHGSYPQDMSFYAFKYSKIQKSEIQNTSTPKYFGYWILTLLVSFQVPFYVYSHEFGVILVLCIYVCGRKDPKMIPYNILLNPWNCEFNEISHSDHVMCQKEFFKYN